MRFILTRDVEEFAQHAQDFLAARVEHNVLATLLVNLRRGRPSPSPPLLAYGVAEGGETAAAALRIPPWPLLVTDLDDDAAGALMDAWLARDPAVAGATGPSASVRAVAAAWAGRTGGTSRCRMREAMHLLEEVHGPERPARGFLRHATEAERDVLVRWEQAFAQEAGVGQEAHAAHIVDARLARDGQFVWDDDGPVSTLATSPEIAHTVRVGPVYTPPEHRCRGYASSGVAAVAGHALAGGAHRCMLFTDLANPTSNSIYAAVGFRRVAEWEEHAFG